MSIISNYINANPILTIDFANSENIDPRIKCLRESQASVIGCGGILKNVLNNVPRMYRDPSSNKCLGLLVESARTNLALHSLDWTTGAFGDGWSIQPRHWRKLVPSDHPNVSGLICEYGPDAETSSFESAANRQVVLNVPAGTYTCTMDLKQVGQTTHARIIPRSLDSSDTFGWLVDLQTGDIITSSKSYGVAFSSENTIKVTKLKNNWFRISIVFTTLINISQLELRAFPYIGRYALIGDGVSGLRGTMLQLENGAWETTHIVTTFSQNTRTFENILFDLFSLGKGTIFVEGFVLGAANSGFIARFHKETNEYLGLPHVTSDGVEASAFVRKSSDISATKIEAEKRQTVGFGKRIKSAVSWDSGLFVFGQNGNVSQDPQSGPNNLIYSSIMLGSNELGQRPDMSSVISRIYIYPKNMTLEQLKALTRL